MKQDILLDEVILDVFSSTVEETLKQMSLDHSKESIDFLMHHGFSELLRKNMTVALTENIKRTINQVQAQSKN